MIHRPHGNHPQQLKKYKTAQNSNQCIAVEEIYIHNLVNNLYNKSSLIYKSIYVKT